MTANLSPLGLETLISGVDLSRPLTSSTALEIGAVLCSRMVIAMKSARPYDVQQSGFRKTFFVSSGKLPPLLMPDQGKGGNDVPCSQFLRSIAGTANDCEDLDSFLNILQTTCTCAAKHQKVQQSRSLWDFAKTEVVRMTTAVERGETPRHKHIACYIPGRYAFFFKDADAFALAKKFEDILAKAQKNVDSETSRYIEMAQEALLC